MLLHRHMMCTSNAKGSEKVLVCDCRLLPHRNIRLFFLLLVCVEPEAKRPKPASPTPPRTAVLVLHAALRHCERGAGLAGWNVIHLPYRITGGRVPF